MNQLGKATIAGLPGEVNYDAAAAARDLEDLEAFLNEQVLPRIDQQPTLTDQALFKHFRTSAQRADLLERIARWAAQHNLSFRYNFGTRLYAFTRLPSQDTRELLPPVQTDEG